MAEQHTSGPWIADDGFIYDAEHRRIADAAPWSPMFRERDDDVVRANARLIAAAPELLDALIDLLLDTQHAGHECQDEHCPVARAKRAISQATGEPLPPNVQAHPTLEASEAGCKRSGGAQG